MVILVEADGSARLSSALDEFGPLFSLCRPGTICWRLDRDFSLFSLFGGVKICPLRPTCRRPDCRHISLETLRRQPDRCRSAAHLTEQQCGDHPVQQHQPGLVAALAVLTQQAEQLGVRPGLGTDWSLVAQPHAPVAPCPANGLSPMLSPGCSGLCRAVRVASGARRFTLWW